VRDQNFEKAASLRDSERELQSEIRAPKQESGSASADPPADDQRGSVALHRCSRWTGIPVTRLQEAETARLLRWKTSCTRASWARTKAIQVISRAIRRKAGRASGSQASDRLVHLQRSYGSGLRRSGACAGPLPVRRGRR